MLRAAAVCLGLFGATSCTVSEVAAGALVRPLRVPVIGTPGVPFEPFSTTAEDGVVLDGWVLLPVGKPRGLVIVLHGKDINRQHFIDDAAALTKTGIVTIAYDQRAHGRSTGEFITYGRKETEDLARVITQSLERWGSNLPVAVVGESLGAAVALQAAARDQRIRAVVAGASFADLQTIIDDNSKWLSARIREDSVQVAERLAKFRVGEVSPERSAEHIQVPVLLLHGNEDTFIPLKHSLRIFAALKGPKQLVRLDGVSHTNVLLTPAAWSRIQFFVDGVFSGTEPFQSTQ